MKYTIDNCAAELRRLRKHIEREMEKEKDKGKDKKYREEQ